MKDCIDKNKKALIILDSLQFLTYRQKREIIDSVEKIENLFLNHEVVFQLLDKWNKSDKKSTYTFAMRESYFDFIKSIYVDVEVVSYLDNDYPAKFLNLEDYPLLIYYSGDYSLIKANNILGVAGSRKTINQALLFTEKVLSSYVYPIITGNSQGVEMLALAKGKNVICVLAGGIRNLYPEESSNLVAKIRTSGLVISEYPPTEKVSKYSFIARNRLIACLCDNLFVVSSSFKSGIRHTVEFALDYGKEIFTLPYTIGETSGELCNELIKNGANVVTRVEDILEYFGIKNERKEIEITPMQQKVLDIITSGVKEIDKIIMESKLRPEEVLTALTILELNDLIVKSGADCYSLSGI